MNFIHGQIASESCVDELFLHYDTTLHANELLSLGLHCNLQPAVTWPKFNFSCLSFASGMPYLSVKYFREHKEKWKPNYV